MNQVLLNIVGIHLKLMNLSENPRMLLIAYIKLSTRWKNHYRASTQNYKNWRNQWLKERINQSHPNNMITSWKQLLLTNWPQLKIVVLSFINCWNRSMMLLNSIRNSPSGKNIQNTLILLSLMESAKVFALLLIT